MTKFENLKSKNIDEFAEWFEENCLYDDDPCIRWFDETYCKNCEPIIKQNEMGYKMEYAYCELNGNCRYFKDMNELPNNKQMVKLWLESEYNDEDSKYLSVPDDYNFEVGM